MGQTQSSDPKASTPGSKTSPSSSTNVSAKDYYALLGVERNATDVEIKKAYRQKALLLHPDRHVGKDIEGTTAHFALVQHAFSILSDPQERAWYDSHMEGVLRGDGDEDGEFFGDGEEGRAVLQADDITRLIGTYAKSTASAKVDYSDSTTGFYKMLSDLFDRLSAEEDTASAYAGVDPTDFPRFGSGKDTQSHPLKQFYTVWGGFSTRKSFRWKDLYNSADAPDRRTRRLAEKENKRVRDEAIREFNDSVRTLVAFVKKRDPRMTTFANQSNATSEAERARLLKQASRKQAAAARAAWQTSVGIDDTDASSSAVPEWARSRDFEDEEISGASEFASENDSQTEAVEQDIFECVVCNKSFKSQGQMDAHEKSKKHLKEMKILERQMRKENAALGLGTEVEWVLSDSQELHPHGQTIAHEDDKFVAGVPESPEPKEEDAASVSDESSLRQAENMTPREVWSPDEALDSEPKAEEVPERAESVDDRESESDGEYAPRDSVLRKLEAVSLATATPPGESLGQEGTVRDGDTESSLRVSQPPKLGKAKIKKAKKAAKAAMGNQDQEKETALQCATCQAGFSSKNKLFEHIKQYNHAQMQPVSRTKKTRR